VFIFGVLALIMTCFYLGYLRFVKYMERAWVIIFTSIRSSIPRHIW
jgi:Na+/H+-dicarboxylate symporter